MVTRRKPKTPCTRFSPTQLKNLYHKQLEERDKIEKRITSCQDTKLKMRLIDRRRKALQRLAEIVAECFSRVESSWPDNPTLTSLQSTMQEAGFHVFKVDILDISQDKRKASIYIHSIGYPGQEYNATLKLSLLEPIKAKADHSFSLVIIDELEQKSFVCRYIASRGWITRGQMIRAKRWAKRAVKQLGDFGDTE